MSEGSGGVTASVEPSERRRALMDWYEFCKNANRFLPMWASYQDRLRKVAKNLNEFALVQSTSIGITNIVGIPTKRSWIG